MDDFYFGEGMAFCLYLLLSASPGLAPGRLSVFIFVKKGLRRFQRLSPFCNRCATVPAGCWGLLLGGERICTRTVGFLPYCSAEWSIVQIMFLVFFRYIEEFVVHARPCTTMGRGHRERLMCTACCCAHSSELNMIWPMEAFIWGEMNVSTGQ